jgi:hypothetical protein
MTIPNGKHVLQFLIWPVVALLGLLVLTSAGMVATALLSPAGELGKMLSQAHAVSRLVALVVIVPSIVALAILDKIEGPVAATALSAIAGYVLGSNT